MPKLLVVFILLALTSKAIYADDEVWSGGGYDHKAEEAKAEKAKRQAQDNALRKKKAKQAKAEAYKKTPEYFKTLNNNDLCARLGSLERKNKPEYKTAYTEVAFRNIAYKANTELVKNQTIQIGMTDCELLASWGSPRKINKHVTATRIHKQYVYGSAYVYTDNGILTSWQE